MRISVDAKAFIKDNTIASETGTAEFDVPKSGWSIATTCEANRWHSIDRAIDGDPTTNWFSSRSTARLPCDVIVDFGESLMLRGFTYLPRQDGRKQSNVYRYFLDVSLDGQDWSTVLTDQTFSNIGNDPSLRRHFSPGLTRRDS
jgi:alpha-L-fucosidase